MDGWIISAQKNLIKAFNLCFNYTLYYTTVIPIDTPYLEKNIIGGITDIIQWSDDSFRMDIQPGSFRKEHNIDILVSTRHSHQYMIPKGYKLLSFCMSFSSIYDHKKI